MNPQTAIETEVVNPFVSKVTTKVDNILTGVKVQLEADMIVPQITTPESMTSLIPSFEDVRFWINWAWRIAARQQVTNMLNFDLGDEKLNDAYDALVNAVNQILDPKATQEERANLIQLLLSQKKFASLSEPLNNFTSEKITVDFTSTHKLEKPSSKRGPKGKAKSADDSAGE